MSFALFIVYILSTYLRPFELLAPQLNNYRPMLILLALALATSTARVIVRNELGARPIHFLLLGLLTLAIGASQVANGWAGGALVAVGDFAASALLMVLCLFNLTSLKRLQVTCIAIASSVVVLAAMGVNAWHTGYLAEELVLRQNAVNPDNVDPLVYEDEPIAIPAQDDSGRYFLRLRSLGFLNDPNDFAQVMVMVLPILWWLVVSGAWWRNLLLAAAPAGLLAYAIYLTHSRGAFLGIGALAALAIHRVLGTLRTLLLVGLAIAAMGIVSVGGRGLSSEEESAAQRVDAWFAGWTMLKSHPLFGVGYSNFLEHHYLTAHNSFVLVYAELGLIGYFFWLGLIVITFLGLNQAVRLAPPGSGELRMAVTVRAAMTAYIACAWFLSRSFQPGLYVVLALGVAAWVIVQKRVGPVALQPPAEPIRWAGITAAAMVLSVMSVYVFIALRKVGGFA